MQAPTAGVNAAMNVLVQQPKSSRLAGDYKPRHLSKPRSCPEANAFKSARESAPVLGSAVNDLVAKSRIRKLTGNQRKILRRLREQTAAKEAAAAEAEAGASLALIPTATQNLQRFL